MNLRDLRDLFQEVSLEEAPEKSHGDQEPEKVEMEIEDFHERDVRTARFRDVYGPLGGRKPYAEHCLDVSIEKISEKIEGAGHGHVRLVECAEEMTVFCLGELVELL